MSTPTKAHVDLAMAEVPSHVTVYLKQVSLGEQAQDAVRRVGPENVELSVRLVELTDSSRYRWETEEITRFIAISKQRFNRGVITADGTVPAVVLCASTRAHGCPPPRAPLLSP